jgi:outer membrane receptor for ferrienterochelin and colicin
VALILALFTTLLFSATTGKLAGTIIDAQTREPLPGANIVVEGQYIGAASDLDGNYVILNVRPGSYTIIISMIGYQDIKFENIQVSVDLTTTINAELQESVEELDAIVVSAERSMVQRDMTSSLAVTSAEQIQNLPVNSIDDLLRLNAGVVQDAGRIHIRGGRPGEVAYWVDGVSVTDVYDGRSGVTVENHSVQELQVISGTFNAEFGQAMSGIVNTITKEGSAQYEGQIRVYAGDYLSNDKKFSVYKSVQTEANENGRESVVSSKREYPLTDFAPNIYNAEFSLSGPIPFLGDKLTFFTNARYVTNEGYFYGVEWFDGIGNSGDSSVVPLNTMERITLQGKLNYQVNNNIKLGYNIFWNTTHRDKNYFGIGDIHEYKYNPNGIPQADEKGLTQILTFNHVLSNSTFYEFRAARYTSENQQYIHKDPTQSVTYISEIGDDGIESFRVDPNSPAGYVHGDSVGRFPATASFFRSGKNLTHSDRGTAYWIGKFDFTSQINKNNLVKAGAEFRAHELELHNFTIIPATDELGSEITPFQPAVPPVGHLNRDDYNQKPYEFSGYLQDKVELNDIIFNIGLRYDYFNSNAYIPKDFSDPSIYNPYQSLNRYYDLNSNGIIDIEEAVLSNETSIADRKDRMLKKASAKNAISPRLGMAFPISERGVVHFSYGHFFQIPEFQYLYANPDFKVTDSSGDQLFGNPDLEPQKTVMYEIGLQQQISDEIGVDVTLFYRDVRDWVGTGVLRQVERDNGNAGVAYNFYENKDYENVKGVTLTIEKRYRDNFSFRGDYTYQIAEGTYSNPNDEFNSQQNNVEPRKDLVPTNWDQRHTLNGQLIFDVQSWTFSLIGRYWSGQPYTPAFLSGSASTSGGLNTGLRTNSERLPDQRSLDLTVNKNFNIFGDTNLRMFINVYNLLDLRDETNVYQDTGTAEITSTIDPNNISYTPSRVSTIADFITQPSWYTAPRQVQVGFSVGF